MACQDTGQILKHIVRIVIAILLIHECVVETFDFPETSKDLEFSYIDGQLNHRSPRNIGLTAVCQPNVTKYQCVCEDGYAWSYNNCQTYEACDDISFGSCGCISGIPSDGEMCVLESALPSNYVIDIDVRFFDWFLVNDLQNLFTNISLPLTLNNNINITDIDVTTVCVLNGTEYECKCEENHVWSSDTCRAYQVCDGIVGGTCGCIQALPSEGPLCQKVISQA
ncbi:hypothetical protein cypCar_00046449 [Cyprinus carpio]|nr:hypothetical protein cypCar_00046449 [Cyprinus carpio]